jgi:putative ABC transport system ATP-binding protein
MLTEKTVLAVPDNKEISKSRSMSFNTGTDKDQIKETVKTNDLWKVYHMGLVEYAALSGVSISINRGEFVSIVGPSGSGKTTLLNLIGTLDIPTQGEVFLNGTCTSNLKSNQLALLRNNSLGFIFQTYNLIPYLNARENVELPLIALNIPSSIRREKAVTILSQLNMADKAGKKPRELSGGEQQRVAIARALVNDPTLILADEPTGNLDSKTSAVVASLLKTISAERNVTIVMVTHNMEITTYSSRIIYLRDGKVEKEVQQA